MWERRTLTCGADSVVTRDQHAALSPLNKNGQHEIAAYGRIGLFGLTEEWLVSG
jgi:hypothetical protein